MDLELAKQLDEQIENTLLARPTGASMRSLAERVIEEEKELIDALMASWRLDYVMRLLKRKQEQINREQRSSQIMLPGYERLPTKITVSSGKRRPLETATLRQLQEYLRVLRRKQRDHPRISQVKSLIDLMTKWKKKLKGAQVTVAEVMHRQADL